MSRIIPPDEDTLAFERPAERIRTLDVPPIPERIVEGLKVYQENALDFTSAVWDREVTTPKDQRSAPAIILTHRPADARVAQKYRIPADDADDTLQRLTHFDIGTGRTISQFYPILGDDWRGAWRNGGAIMVMDLDGSEKTQLWRYWEDALTKEQIPRLESELDNSPGVGRIERLTHDEFRYLTLVVSDSDRLLAYSSNKEDNKDTLVYITPLIESNTGVKPDSTARFTIPGTAVTPKAEKGTARWGAEDFSADDCRLIVTDRASSSSIVAYVVDISTPEPSAPERIILPGTTKEGDVQLKWPTFSKNPDTPTLIYMVTDSYGDFSSVVIYDSASRSVSHITTPEPNLHALRAINWDTGALSVTRDVLYFKANVQGWDVLYAMPLTGAHANQVYEIDLGWEGGNVWFSTNADNGKPFELVLRLRSHTSSGFIAKTDLLPAFDGVDAQEAPKTVKASLTRFAQAAGKIPSYPTQAPKLLKWNSFDGLEISGMYYRPNRDTGAVPLIINIHGGPASQATAATRNPIHDYVLNEMGCALLYPNVRGSSGFGKKFMAADDVEKREDSVKDIGALLDYVKTDLSSELDSSRIAVMGGSYGGYMLFATLVHYSDKVTCGYARFGISHWPSFLDNTADHRRDHRRVEYGDESIPEVRAMLERISPVNHAEKITKPMGISHGEKDTRVPLSEALRMWDIVKKQGVVSELTVCEMEGHGYKQKSVIEYTNAATVHFFERFLLSGASKL